MAGVAVEVSGIGKRYGATEVLRDISLTFPAGLFTVLLGPPGCGKASLLRITPGLDGDTPGSVLIAGRDAPPLPPVRPGVAVVFPSYGRFRPPSVPGTSAFGLRARGAQRAERELRLARAAAMVGLDQLLARKPNQLSCGQQQRVALARAIVAETPVCLMDEPLSNLDAKLRHEMRREIRALQRKLGLTMIYVTHDQAEAMSMADQVVVMNRGRVEQVGAPADLHARPAAAFVAGFLGSPPMNLLPAVFSDGRLRVPGGWLACAARHADLHGPLLAGLRPQHLRPDPQGALRGVVECAEYLGDATLATVLLGEERHPAQALLPGHHVLKPSAPIAFAAPDDIHLFDETTGRRVEPAPAARALLPT